MTASPALWRTAPAGSCIPPLSASAKAAEGRSARPRRPSGAFRSRPSSIRRENRSAEEKGGSQKLRREAPKRQLPFPFFHRNTEVFTRARARRPEPAPKAKCRCPNKARPPFRRKAPAWGLDKQKQTDGEWNSKRFRRYAGYINRSRLTAMTAIPPINP